MPCPAQPTQPPCIVLPYTAQRKSLPRNAACPFSHTPRGANPRARQRHTHTTPSYILICSDSDAFWVIVVFSGIAGDNDDVHPILHMTTRHVHILQPLERCKDLGRPSRTIAWPSHPAIIRITKPEGAREIRCEVEVPDETFPTLWVEECSVEVAVDEPLREGLLAWRQET